MVDTHTPWPILVLLIPPDQNGNHNGMQAQLVAEQEEKEASAAAGLAMAQEPPLYVPHTYYRVG